MGKGVDNKIQELGNKLEELIARNSTAKKKLVSGDYDEKDTEYWIKILVSYALIIPPIFKHETITDALELINKLEFSYKNGVLIVISTAKREKFTLTLVFTIFDKKLKGIVIKPARNAEALARSLKEEINDGFKEDFRDGLASVAAQN